MSKKLWQQFHIPIFFLLQLGIPRNHNQVKLCHIPTRDIHILRQKKTGWGAQEMPVFADVHNCIYADIVGGKVRKDP